jgi:nucleoside-diphosphate-sugar epimerase
MRALVTGGGGFIGSHVAMCLHERGDEVTVLGRSAYPAIESRGIRAVRGDVRDGDLLAEAFRGMGVVFHVAAIPGIWGDRRLFETVNVGGTRNVIAACRSAGVPRLVFTSSPSVVFGIEALCGVDESQPYPERYESVYAETKAAAERLVLAANDTELATVSIRPHLVWGPGDPNLIPRVIERARQGRLVQVGDGSNLVDITYIDNCATAHVLAADALHVSAACAGKAYFISQGEPVRLWGWLSELLAAVGAPPVRRTISYSTARRVGGVLEAVHRLLRLRGEPRMTRFLAGQLAKSHYFRIDAARRDFGYVPAVSTGEGVRRLVAAMTGK